MVAVVLRVGIEVYVIIVLVRIEILDLLAFVWVAEVLFHVCCVSEVLARHVEHVEEEMEVGLGCVVL